MERREACRFRGYFYPRPPRGGRRAANRSATIMLQFLSTPSARRATLLLAAILQILPISIHALREEGDAVALKAVADGNKFLSTPSARRATGLRAGWCFANLFLSTPSARRATTCPPSSRRSARISIHALREEGDQSGCCRHLPAQNFYPRPPRGGRQCVVDDWPSRGQISIHALREEGDARQGPTAPRKGVFLSTPSARRATAGYFLRFAGRAISIHALREEGDHRRSTASSVHPISIHALREEGDFRR